MKYRGIDKKGFTLIEIVASLVVITIGLVGILSLFPLGIGAARTSGNVTAATIIAKTEMEMVRNAITAKKKTGEPLEIDDLIKKRGKRGDWYNFGDFEDPAPDEGKERTASEDNDLYEFSIDFFYVVRDVDDNKLSYIIVEEPSVSSSPPDDWEEGLYAVRVNVYWPRATAPEGSSNKKDVIKEKQRKQRRISLVTLIRLYWEPKPMGG